MTRLTKCYFFNATHELPITGEPHIHGHSYRLEVSLKGEPQAETGLLTSEEQMDNIINEHCVSYYHGQHLNNVTAHTSGESICVDIFKMLLKTSLAPLLDEVALKETGKNWFRVKN